MNWLEGVKGFTAASIHCGIRKDKEELCLLAADGPCTAAAVYTTNRVQAAPLAVTRRHLADGTAQAVIVNAGNANACAPEGEERALRMCRAAAEALGVKETDVLVASTGVIGVQLPVEKIEAAVPALAAKLSVAGGESAARAILTTDLYPKQASVTITLGGKPVRLSGMAKGSGMIHPNMATMLAFLVTDAAVPADLLRRLLAESARVTFNRVSVDGDTSTNDMAIILASGQADNLPLSDEDILVLRGALDVINGQLARMIARDGEGATKLITCRVTGAHSEDVAGKLAKSVISSSLVKAAMFGADANWGRVLCAMGYAGVPFGGVDISFMSSAGIARVCANGTGVPFDESIAKTILQQEEIDIVCELRDGDGQAEAYGCDLTYDYVKINGAYRT